MAGKGNSVSFYLEPQRSIDSSPLKTPNSASSSITSAPYVSYEAEEEPYNPRHLPCCDRLKLESSCDNMNLSVWTTLGRLEWADAFGRGSGGCGWRLCRMRRNRYKCCSVFDPLGPGSMRNLRIFLFLACTALNIVSILTWNVASLMKFTHWLTITSNVYLFAAMKLCSWLHDQDEVPLEITLFGKLTWFIHVFVFAPVVAISAGYWLTHFLFADLQPTPIDGIDHAAIAVLMVIDFYFGAQPYFFIHYFYNAMFLTLWLLFSVAHFLLEFGPVNPDGQYYVYDFVNWNNPERTGIVMVLIFIFSFVVHFIIWILSRGRDVPFKHYESTLKL